ncbi:phosphoribosylglycinamide formyltransferase [Myriangium duriaei CBS 260.36]|uniref:Phosphoribosylglycinamide formyltransferase n=1 Tax=Myriangium duriaei CBS 260.36 TaxID=1168546 RepID=A0A9P4ML58_9PEZI|nr:phosphoribosylglycinamide formyltransferase [Myriangium duriaei CBS 260.36]
MSADDTPTRITVLISGGGTNLQALIDAASTPALPNVQFIRVISNRKTAFGLQRAEKAGIPTSYHNLVGYKSRFPDPEGASGKHTQARTEYDRDLATLVLKDKPDIVVCAGWMHILAPTFLNPLQEAGVPVINLHPALPGAFNGTHAIQRAHEAFQKGEVSKTGAMVHHVISEVDMGSPILVREVEIKKAESVDELEERIHQVEWKIIVDGTRIAIEELRSKKNGRS